jgi:uncharacterized cupredoxin-like copper-binding protein
MSVIDQIERLLVVNNLKRSSAMHQARYVLLAAVAASFVSLAPAAFGHGEGGHGKPKAVDYSKAEETPFGRAADPKKANRTITISMNDRMQFVVAAGAKRGHATDAATPGTPPHAMPGDITVKRGETIRFVVHNDGQVMHEMVIGRMKELKEHAELMRKFPTMEHDEPYMAHVVPGKQGDIVWQFTQAGEFHYACLIPGHMEAGMIAKITVK